MTMFKEIKHVFARNLKNINNADQRAAFILKYFDVQNVAYESVRNLSDSSLAPQNYSHVVALKATNKYIKDGDKLFVNFGYSAQMNDLHRHIIAIEDNTKKLEFRFKYDTMRDISITHLCRELDSDNMDAISVYAHTKALEYAILN